MVKAVSKSSEVEQPNRNLPRGVKLLSSRLSQQKATTSMHRGGEFVNLRIST